MFVHFQSKRITNAQTLQAPTIWAAAAVLWPFCRMAFVSAPHMAELVAHSLVSPGTAAPLSHTPLFGLPTSFASFTSIAGGVMSVSRSTTTRQAQGWQCRNNNSKQPWQ